jgi:protein TonB
MPVEPEPITPVEPGFVAEDEAMFPGGTLAMMKFITDNIKISETDLEIGCMGKVYVRMVVGIDGKITNPEVLKGISGCPGLSQSALDVIKQMPDWIPAQNNSKKVASYVTIPVTIKYQ